MTKSYNHKILADTLVDLMDYKTDCMYMAVGHDVWTQDNVPDYCSDEVANVIRGWTEEELESIVRKMIDKIEDNRDEISDANVCPFCIKHNMRCSDCEYAVTSDNGPCTRSDNSRIVSC